MTKTQQTQNYTDFIQPCGIGAAPYFAGTYEGNQCAKIIKNRDKFRSMIEKWRNKNKFLPICNVMDDLAEVNNKCYKIKINLNENDLKMIKIAIENLKKSWKEAGLSITVKSHNLFEHGWAFMVRFLVTLGVLSAQDGESIHRLYRVVFLKCHILGKQSHFRVK